MGGGDLSDDGSVRTGSGAKLGDEVGGLVSGKSEQQAA